jgi:hypothetical protein
LRPIDGRFVRRRAARWRGRVAAASRDEAAINPSSRAAARRACRPAATRAEVAFLRQQLEATGGFGDPRRANRAERSFNACALRRSRRPRRPPPSLDRGHRGRASVRKILIS